MTEDDLIRHLKRTPFDTIYNEIYTHYDRFSSMSDEDADAFLESHGWTSEEYRKKLIDRIIKEVF